MIRVAAALCRIAVTAVLAGAAVLPAFAGEVAVVTNRVVYPGDLIEAAMVEEVPLVRGKRNLGPIFQESKLVVGKVAKRTILPGRLIPASAVRDSYLVQQGAPVEVVLIEGPMVITITALSLEAGSAGDVVKVRNIDSGRVFSGIIMADGTVRVGAS